MHKLKSIFALSLSVGLFLSAGVEIIHAQNNGYVSVKLSNYLGNQTSVAIQIKGVYSIEEREYLKLSASYTLKKEGNGMRLTGSGVSELLPSSFIMTPQMYGKDHLVLINGRAYMGEMAFGLENGYIRPMNTLAMEHYLKGVVPKEMPSSWNEEALKAQSVAARTYAERKSGEILTDTQTHQVFGGYDWTSSTTRAVEETEGEVLTYEGKLIEALYTSSNGGMSESNHGAWGSMSLPYLKAKADPFDPQTTFTYQVSQAALVNILNGTSGINVRSVEAVKIKNYTDGKRVDTLSFSVNGDETAVEMKATTLRSRLGSMNIRSTYLTLVQKNGNHFIFSGKGFGHGVGMSQYGANIMAEKGYSYKEILGFYFEGSTLMKNEKQVKLDAPVGITPDTMEPFQLETEDQTKKITEIAVLEEEVLAEEKKEEKTITYLVKKGDSLYLISRKYELKVEELKKWNGLTANTIYVGQKLRLTKPLARESVAEKTYAVKKGDTLYRISKTFNVSTDQLKKWNNIQTNTLHIGQKLIVLK